MANTESWTVELVEKEILTTDFVEKELIEVKLYSVDVGLGIRRNLNDLDDVVITSVQDDEVLSYDSASELWINKSLSEIQLTQLVMNEVPNLVAGATYSVNNKYVNDSLQVFVNGLKQISTDVSKNGNNKQFTLAFTLEITDTIEVAYVKQD